MINQSENLTRDWLNQAIINCTSNVFNIEIQGSDVYTDEMINELFASLNTFASWHKKRIMILCDNDALYEKISKVINLPLARTQKIEGGYHLTPIKKGVYGDISKVQEEISEYNDAAEQKNTIMMLCELADIYGALEAVAKSHNLSMNDLAIMANATKRAFESGQRK